MLKFRHRSTLPLIIGTFALVIAALLFAYRSFPRQTTLPAGANLSVIGVQLDQTKDDVDLHQLENNGVSFIYLRATQGKSYFDDNYDIYRDKVQGTKLAFGSIIYVSDQSKIIDQWKFFQKKVGSNSGTLPILLRVAPGVNPKRSFYQRMATFTSLIIASGKKVMVSVPAKYRSFFPMQTHFLSSGKITPNKERYSFWLYTSNGHVKNTQNMENDVTMYAYNGTMAQYKQLYGELTQ